MGGRLRAERAWLFQARLGAGEPILASSLSWKPLRHRVSYCCWWFFLSAEIHLKQSPGFFPSLHPKLGFPRSSPPWEVPSGT